MGGFGLLELLTVISLITAVAGPWPVYKHARYKSEAYYQEALQALDAVAASSGAGATGGTLRAGWAVREITPEVGTPMAGYGGRPNGKRSTGVHDPVYVKAIALNDGEDTVVLVGADMLQTLPNLVALVEKAVAEETPLRPGDILYHTSHSHCGPGGLAPGLAANISYGAYDPAVVEFLARRFAEAIVEAWKNMAPAELADGLVEVPDYIVNRTRNAPVDAAVNFCVVKQEGGSECIVMRYSAHPTVYGQDMLQFTAEYPGAFQRAVERETGATAIYIGGAVGSMGPRAPEAAGGTAARVEAMGEGLARKLLDDMGTLEFSRAVDVASFACYFGMPSFQMRPLSPGWRVSPVFIRLFGGLPPFGRMQMARIGDMVFVGMPYDFSGETAVAWRTAAGSQINLWVTSHSGAYLGYLSPDKYYDDLTPEGAMDYETGLMGWFGPDTEAYMTDLFERGLERLSQAPETAVASIP